MSVSFATCALFEWRTVVLACAGLAMDGQRRDEFLHCTDSCLEQERINFTFRCIWQHVASCVFFKDRSGVLCANVCAGFTCCCYGVCEDKRFWRNWVLPRVPLCRWDRTRPVVGGGIIFVGVHWFPPQCASQIGRSSCHHVDVMLCVLVQ